MMNSITRNLNIVPILTKTKDRKQIFCQYNYIYGLHMQEAKGSTNPIFNFGK